MNSSADSASVLTSGRRPAPSCSRPHAPDLERAARTGEFWSYPQSRAFAELLIGCEEDRALGAVLVGMLRDRERRYGDLRSQGPGGRHRAADYFGRGAE